MVETVCNKQQIRVLGLSEIWHPDNSIKDNVKKAWNWIATERKGERGGGAALMISKSQKIFERKDLYDVNVEAVWCNVYTKEVNFLVGSIYIPPNNSKALKSLMKVIERIVLQPLPVILIGDFNAHHPYWNDNTSNKLGNELFEFLSDKDLTPMNNDSPTRKDKIIDLTIVSNNLSGKIMNWKVQNETYLNTDHSLISFDLGDNGNEEILERLTLEGQTG